MSYDRNYDKQTKSREAFEILTRDAIVTSFEHDVSRTLTSIFYGDIFVLIITSLSSIVVQAPLSSTFVSCRQRDTDDFDSLLWPEASGIDNHRLCSRFTFYIFSSSERGARYLGKTSAFCFATSSGCGIFTVKRTRRKRILLYASIATRLFAAV